MYPLESLCDKHKQPSWLQAWKNASFTLFRMFSLHVVLYNRTLSAFRGTAVKRTLHQLQWLNSHRHNTSLLTFMFSFHATLVFGY